MLAPTTGHNSPLRSVPAPKARLLLVADSAERLKRLGAELRNSAFEVSCAGSPEELQAACRSQHELVALDLDATRIKPALSCLRGNVLHANVPLLVESARLGNAPGLAGVLPAFRAMPCSRNELLLLAQFYSEGGRKADANRAALL